MYSKDPDIASLISSRICHDLVSPLGAISNGLELLELAGVPTGPEYGLLNDSVANATARINFFRYAFGAGGDGSALSDTKVRATLDGFYAGSRVAVHWSSPRDLPRREAKLALLIIQCLETFLPVGGRITASGTDGQWHFTAEDARLRLDPDNLAHLLDQRLRGDLKPSEIQFELARHMLRNDGITPDCRETEGEFTLSYRFQAA